MKTQVEQDVAAVGMLHEDVALHQAQGNVSEHSAQLVYWLQLYAMHSNGNQDQVRQAPEPEGPEGLPSLHFDVSLHQPQGNVCVQDAHSVNLAQTVAAGVSVGVDSSSKSSSSKEGDGEGEGEGASSSASK
mmetsp:Transcript_27483/g.47430  ORF Transcript_27483/g.47430 Transcript_27483/m.47430 type:complete len:131 (-) Transcript_27483:121-513(-)